MTEATTRWLLRGLLLCLLALAAGPASAGETCWRDSYGRGVGTIPLDCDLHEERQGLFCYPNCGRGYTGLLNVCWQDCPTGARDDGAFCRYAEYGRGAGYPWKFGDKAFSLDGARERCRRDNPGLGCEKSGEIIYPRCKPGYEPFGCCICRPSKVDCGGMAGRFDLSCAKKTYTRGTMTANCGGGKEADAGLCYDACKTGYDGVGPVCWGQCPLSHPVNCGASCATTSAACAEAVTDQVVSVLDIAANIAITVATLGTGTGAKVAANTAAKAAKVGAKQGATIAAKQSLKSAAKQGLRQAANKLSKQQIKTSLRQAKEAALRKGGKAAQEARKWDEDKLEKMADLLDKAQGASELAQEDDISPLDIAEIADPTGIVAVVNAYYSPVCSAPMLAVATATQPASPPSGIQLPTQTQMRQPAAQVARPVPQPAAPAAQGLVRIQNRWKPGDYLHNQHGGLQAGAIQPGWWSAEWSVEQVPGERFVRLRNRWKPGEYLHNQHGGIQSGPIQAGWWSAQWSLEPVSGTNFVFIRNRWKTGEYLHVQHGRIESGAVQPGWWSAHWNLQQAGAPVPQPQAQAQPTAVPRPQVQAPVQPQPRQQAAAPQAATAGALFRIQNRWKPGEFLHNQHGGIQSGAIQPGWWSAQWTVEQVPGERFVRLRNRWKPGEYLHNQHGGIQSGPIQPGWWSAQWSLEPVPGTSFVFIRNRWKTGEYLHVERGRIESGAIQPGWWSAHWNLQRAG